MDLKLQFFTYGNNSTGLIFFCQQNNNKKVSICTIFFQIMLNFGQFWQYYEKLLVFDPKTLKKSKKIRQTGKKNDL